MLCQECVCNGVVAALHDHSARLLCFHVRCSVGLYVRSLPLRRSSTLAHQALPSVAVCRQASCVTLWRYPA